MQNHDNDDDIDTITQAVPHDNDSTAYTTSSSSRNTPATASTAGSSEKTAGRWTDDEINRLLDYVEVHCILTTSKGLSLKKSNFNKAREMVKSKDAGQCHYKWGHLWSIYKAISLWDKKSGSGWNDDHGANVRTPAEKQVFEEWLKTPEHAPLKPFATKPWPFYRRMQRFMPGTQPRGIHAFDPGSSSCQSSAQVLDAINAEADGEEDQVGPSLTSPLAAANALSASPLFMPNFEISSLEGTSSVKSAPSLSDHTAASAYLMPPPSSSISPTVLPPPAQRRDVSMSSVHSVSDSDVASSQRKRKYDARSLDSAPPPSSKRATKTKTADLNPVILTNALNSTLIRIADVIEKSLDVTTTVTGPATSSSIAPSPITTSPVESQAPPPPPVPLQLSPMATSSTPAEDQVIRNMMADGSYSEDELLAASIFFSNVSEDVAHAARTFLTLGGNGGKQTVQRRFLLHKLQEAALLPGRGKGKAVEDNEDHSMRY